MYIRVKAKSKWRYITSGETSVSAGVGIAKGVVQLKSPISYMFNYHYVSISIGLDVGVSIGTYSDADTFSVGDIWLAEKFRGQELSPSDLEGFCNVRVIGGGIGVGASGTVMVLGLSANDVGLGLTITPVGRNQDGPTALLAMAGFNSGAQVQAGISYGLGYVWTIGEQPEFVDYFSDMAVGPEKLYDYKVSRHDGSFWSFPMTALFDFDKAVVKPQDLESLFRLARALQQLKPRVVHIDGHTDSIGRLAYNKRLSQRRAEAVMRFLQPFLPMQRFSLNGYGETRHLTSNATSVGRRLNRRVDVFVPHD